jgi:hypothetical protein
MTLNRSEIELKAQQLGFTCETIIPSVFSEIEYLGVKLSFGKTALFLMDNETFKFTYSHTYNALTDKTTKSKPKGF